MTQGSWVEAGSSPTCASSLANHVSAWTAEAMRAQNTAWETALLPQGGWAWPCVCKEVRGALVSTGFAVSLGSPEHALGGQ